MYKKVILRFLLLILCLALTVPQVPVHAESNANIANSSPADSSFIAESSLNATEHLSKIPPKASAVVSGAVYDQNLLQSIESIKAMTLQKDRSLISAKYPLTVSTLQPSTDLTKRQIEELALAGASIEDVYWINFLSRESTMTPLELLNLKLTTKEDWEGIRADIGSGSESGRVSVNADVYQNSSVLLNVKDVESAVYRDSPIQTNQALIESNLHLASFAATANNVFDGLITQQLINQTNKQQYSDHNLSSEVIDPASGSLTWKETEISLPGRDGLDLNIGVMYNSNQAFGYMRSYSEYRYLKKYNYLISRYDLGVGWSFQFPSVQSEDGYLYYHNGQGSIYRIDLAASDAVGSFTHLVGYQGKDLQFMQDNGSYNNGQASSSYYLEYANKKREYFADDGRLLGIVDRYGNEIKFEHIDRQIYDGKTYKVISAIKDTLNRTVNFTYESNLNNADFNGEKITISVSAPNGAVGRKVILNKGRIGLTFDGNPDGYAPYLWQISNQEFGSRFLAYDLANNAKYDYNKKYFDSLSGYSFYANLVQVVYPNSSTNYQFEVAQRNLGSGGLGEECRVTGRDDEINGIKYNQAGYSYAGDYTGYPSYWANPPSSYTFSSTSVVQSNSLMNRYSTTRTYNGQQQSLSNLTEAANGEKKLETNTAFDPIYTMLPTQVAFAEYEKGDTESTAVKLYSETAYTDWGGIFSQTKPLNLEQNNDAAFKGKYTTTYNYEPLYRQLQSKSWFQNSSAPVSETYQYESNGRVKSYTNPQNEVTSYSYEYTTQAPKKVSQMTETKTMQNGLTAKTVTSYGSDTNYAYPSDVQRYFTNISASGVQTSLNTRQSMIYDPAMGYLLELSDAAGKKTKYMYDQLGRPISIVYPTITNLDGKQYSVEDQYQYSNTYGSSYYGFDSVNSDVPLLQVSYKRVYKEIASGAVTNISNQLLYYDGLGFLRLSKMVDSGAVTQYHPDDLSRAVYISDPAGNVTTVAYDAWGKQQEASDTYGNLYVNEYQTKQRKEISYFVAAADVGAYRNNMGNSAIKASYVEKSYDQWGQLTSNKAYKDWPAQNEPISESYSYDIAGNTTGYIDPNNNVNNEGLTVKYTYDGLNRLTSLKDALGQVTSYQYDINGKITDSSVKNGDAGTPERLLGSIYNEIGLPSSTTDNNSSSQRQEYNNLGLLRVETDRNGSVINLEYDERDQLVNQMITGLSGNSQQNRYIFGSSTLTSDTNEIYLNGLLTSSQTAQTDTVKRLIALSTKAGSFTSNINLNYDPADRITRLYGSDSVTGGFYTNYKYDKLRLNKVQTDGNSAENSNANANAIYEYYAAGKLKSINYPAFADGSSLRTEYSYDKLNRLWTLQNKKGTEILSSYMYAYDNNGNIKSVTETLKGVGSNRTTTYTYDKLNRLTLTIHPDQTQVAYTYDLKGNRLTTYSTTVVPYTGLVSGSFTFDLENKLTGVNQDTGTTTFDYLPGGLRYQKKTGVATVQYNYNSKGEIISESKSTGEKSIYIRGDRLLIKRDISTASPKDYYYLYNGHGDVVQIVDSSGVIVNIYTYDEWGNILSQTQGISNSFKYAGEIYDEETGLYYLRARYYDPSLGRFLNEDTYTGDINNPLSLNLYTYAENNPVIYADPTGNWCSATVNGKYYSHPGECNGSGSGQNYVKDSNAVNFGRQVYEAGKVVGQWYPQDSFYIKGDKTGISDAFIGCAYDSDCLNFVTFGLEGVVVKAPKVVDVIETGAKKAWTWAKSIFAFSSAKGESVQLLQKAAQTQDVIIGAFDGGKITKQFLMTADNISGHKDFLEGTERGFLLFKNITTGAWDLKSSGTASRVGGKYLTEKEFTQIRRIFGLD